MKDDGVSVNPKLKTEYEKICQECNIKFIGRKNSRFCKECRKKHKHIERSHIIFKNFYLGKKGQILEHKSARGCKELYDFWKLIKPLSSDEIQFTITLNRNKIKYLDLKKPENNLRKRILQTKIKIATDYYKTINYDNNLDRISSKKAVIIEDFKQRLITVEIFDDSDKTNKFKGLGGVQGYINAKGQIIGYYNEDPEYVYMKPYELIQFDINRRYKQSFVKPELISRYKNWNYLKFCNS